MIETYTDKHTLKSHCEFTEEIEMTWTAPPKRYVLVVCVCVWCVCVYTKLNFFCVYIFNFSIICFVLKESVIFHIFSMQKS